MTLDDVITPLACSGATYRIAPGMVISATFHRREQRDRFRSLFLGATIREPAWDGPGFKLTHDRTWIDEHGYGVILRPAPTTAITG